MKNKKNVIGVVGIVAVVVIGLLAAAYMGAGKPQEILPTSEPVSAATTAPTAEPAHEPTAEPAEPTELDEQAQEDGQTLFGLSGLITEVTPDYVVITDAEQGEVQVNYGEETVFEGIDAGSLAVGQYIYVDYDGKMTRSLPPQVFALRLVTHRVTGTVRAVQDSMVTIDRDGEEIIVHLPEGAPELAVGQKVTAYTNGVTTLSLPPQMTANHVTVE